MPLAEHEEMILTDAQYQAFQEAFELFDKNGGGTIDAAELQKTLDDCGIYVNGDDLGMSSVCQGSTAQGIPVLQLTGSGAWISVGNHHRIT